MAVAHHAGAHQGAVVHLVVAGQHGGQCGFVLFEADVGNKPQPPGVDADQRHLVARQLAAYAQHGAVATYHQGQVAMGANAVYIHGGVVAQARVGGGVGLDHHLAALVHQIMGNLVQRFAGRGPRSAGAGGLVLADQSDMPK